MFKLFKKKPTNPYVAQIEDTLKTLEKTKRVHEQVAEEHKKMLEEVNKR